MAYVSVDTVKTRTERVVATLPAQLVMDEDHTVRVGSPVVGRIRTVDVEPGDRVVRDQPLAHIISSDLALAASDLAKADAAQAQTAATLRRSEDLFAHHVVAERDLEQARSDAAQAQAEQVRARQRVAQLGGLATAAAGGEDAGGDFVLRAPLAGEIIDRSANAGAEVRNDNGTTLFTISSLDTLWLVASAYQQDLANVRRGEHLVFTTDAAPDRRFVATVSYVSGALDSTTRTVRVRATLPNPARLLKPLTYGQARLLAPDTGHVPVVPTQALITVGTETVVFVQVGPGRFVRRPVVVANDDGVMASIAEGLRPGELVATRGSILLAGAAAAP
jgi:cobalt-zinc-cadmium efflux system membrane fusion protein